jgi:hypothetical protein
MKRKWMAALVMGITMLAGAAQANSGSGDPNDPNNPGNVKRQCIADARTEKKTCNQVCKDDFITATDTCRGLNHDCAEQARDARDQCVADVLTQLKDCIQTQCGVFQDLIDQCRHDFQAHTAERDHCIDGAQLQRFQCRDQCRESVKLFSSLKACRDEFKADLKACVSPPTPTPMGK